MCDGCWFCWCSGFASWNWLNLELVLPAEVSLTFVMIIIQGSWGQWCTTWKHAWAILHFNTGVHVLQHVTSGALDWSLFFAQVNTFVFCLTALNKNRSPSMADHVASEWAKLLFSFWTFINDWCSIFGDMSDWSTSAGNVSCDAWGFVSWHWMWTWKTETMNFIFHAEA
jgi:hypothetical protein